MKNWTLKNSSQINSNALGNAICKMLTILFRPRYVEGIDTSFSVMAVTPQTPKCHHNRGASRGCGGIWESVVSQPWPKTRYQFLFYHGTTKLTLNYESLSSQTASQLSKFKGQSHCKHWVTWPDCFATPSNNCDVTAGLVSLNYVDTLEKIVTKYTMIQREYEEEDTENILLTYI